MGSFLANQHIFNIARIANLIPLIKLVGSELSKLWQLAAGWQIWITRSSQSNLFGD